MSLVPEEWLNGVGERCHARPPSWHPSAWSSTAKARARSAASKPDVYSLISRFSLDLLLILVLCYRYRLMLALHLAIFAALYHRMREHRRLW